MCCAAAPAAARGTREDLVGRQQAAIELLHAAGNGTIRFLDLGASDLLIGIGSLDRLLDLEQGGNRL